ncbi:MAG: DUF1127 domain-containing protein [Reyranella sp.]|nr:DUF1127 domain-containing protein [Reyranella sp.]
MSMFLQSMFGRWRAMRRRHRAEHDLRTALFELNDHLLKDIGLPAVSRHRIVHGWQANGRISHQRRTRTTRKPPQASRKENHVD